MLRKEGANLTQWRHVGHPSVCGTSPGSSCIPHSTSVPCDLNAASMECATQGPSSKVVIYPPPIEPPPIEVDLPGPILRVFPEACKVETVSSCAPKVGELCSSNPPALCSNSNGTTSTALATKYSSSSTIKRPLPDIRRPARPWAEMYNRSLTPKRILANQSHITKYGRSFSSASYHSAY
uniref:Uncharacterized protein n=1 Tax=Varanus komodoensis TaxID=61221 RepID=A0A8D2J813_VARKO